MTPFCTLCRHTAFQTWFEHPPYAVVQCEQCRLVQIEPKPTPEVLADLYGQSYFKSPSAKDSGYQDYVGEWENYLRTFRRRFRCVRRFLDPGGALLEVGMACGAFLRVLQEKGFTDLHGVDVSEFAVQHGRSVLEKGTDLRVGSLGDQPFDRRFDTVVMWDVVEHLADPLAELRHVRTLMNPEAHLILETQDVGSMLARVSGLRWHMFKFPEHIYHFDRYTIRKLLDEAGFRVVLLTKRAAGKYISGEFLMERIGRYGRPLRWLVAPFRRHLPHLYVNPHDEMIVVAKRSDAPTT